MGQAGNAREGYEDDDGGGGGGDDDDDVEDDVLLLLSLMMRASAIFSLMPSLLHIFVVVPTWIEEHQMGDFLYDSHNTLGKTAVHRICLTLKL
jgi:hypothetical protein